MKKYLAIFSFAFIVVVIFFADFFLITHTIKTELIEEIKYDKSYSYAYGEKYFFIKDEDYNGFYDGKTVLKHYLSEFDFSLLDTEGYTYFVCVGGKLNSIKYNGRKCKLRTYFAFPDEYEAIIDSEVLDDGVIRIYRMKKINIDYDYHSE